MPLEHREVVVSYHLIDGKAQGPSDHGIPQPRSTGFPTTLQFDCSALGPSGSNLGSSSCLEFLYGSGAQGVCLEALFGL